AVGGGNDEAAAEVFHALFGLERATRSLKEGIEVRLTDTGGRQVELALDRGPRTVVHTTGDQVDTGVRFATVVAPISPAVDLIKLSLQRGVGAEIIDHQLFKSDAVCCLRLILTQLSEELGKLRHGDIMPLDRTHSTTGTGVGSAPHTPSPMTC